MAGKYHPSASSYTRIRYGFELIAGLNQFPESAPLAVPFEAVNRDLNEQRMVRENAELSVAPLSAQVRIADYQCDRVARLVARAAEMADGGRRGPIFGALFPNGITEVVSSAGASQVQSTQALERRLAESHVPGIEPIRTEWAPRLAEARGRLQEAVSGRTAALAALAQSRAKEIALQQDHEIVIDKVLGQVRTLFPRDRARQDAIFPASFRSAGSRDDEGEPENSAKTATPDA